MKKVALITGASSGIGKELTLIHARRGGDLVLVARREDKLSELKQQIEANHKVSVLLLPDDLNDEAAPQRIFDRLQADGIEIEYLINNAGFGGHGRFHERDWARDRSMIQVNIVALTALTRLFLPGFVQRNRGRILNISSAAAFTPGPWQAVYHASKSYVTFLSNALAVELHDTRVTVTALMPGATESEFASTSGMDKTNLFDKPISARKAAEAGYKGMLKGKLDVVVGLSFAQRQGLRLSRLFPKRMVLNQIRKLQEIVPSTKSEEIR